jgi:hypothetical protein
VFKALTLTHWEDQSLFWIKLSVGTWRDHFSWQSRRHIPVIREVKKPPSL